MLPPCYHRADNTVINDFCVSVTPFPIIRILISFLKLITHSELYVQLLKTIIQ